jgi:hypothetical protein
MIPNTYLVEGISTLPDWYLFSKSLQLLGRLPIPWSFLYRPGLRFVFPSDTITISPLAKPVKQVLT